MSRSGYTNDGWGDNSVYLWRGAVNRAINGKRGQAFLKDMLAALEAKPEKTLVAHALETEDGNHCALGVIGHLRGVEMPVGNLDYDDYDDYNNETTINMAHKLNIAPALAQEIVFINDEYGDYYGKQTPEDRYSLVYNWVKENIHS